MENGIPRDLSSYQAEDSSQSQSRSLTQENGFLASQEEQDSEKDKDDSLTLPRKKRGRRKLERPTKCEFFFLFFFFRIELLLSYSTLWVHRKSHVTRRR